ncbi:MAG: hypothetical protein JNL32_12150 [Candidatus Kapabacteria bacterium]|nr:hypothetical protein [Candidatus Kapabacteria bacterium]
MAIGNIVVSKDRSYAAMLIGRDGPIVLRVNWGTTDVQENPDIKPLAQVIPMPGIENLAYSLSSPYSLPNVMLSVVTMDGRSVQDVYRGTIEAGTTRIPIPTGGMASGAYTARLQYGSTVISTPFIITK